MRGDIEERLRRIESVLSLFEKKLYEMEQRLEKAFVLLNMARSSIPASS